MQYVLNYNYLQVLNKSEQSDYKPAFSSHSITHSSYLITSSSDAAKPAVTEETESMTSSTVSTPAPSSSAEQALSTAESTLGKLTTAGVGTEHRSIQTAIKLSVFFSHFASYSLSSPFLIITYQV